MAIKTARTEVMNDIATEAHAQRTCSGALTARGMTDAWMRVPAATDSSTAPTEVMN